MLQSPAVARLSAVNATRCVQALDMKHATDGADAARGGRATRSAWDMASCIVVPESWGLERCRIPEKTQGGQGRDAATAQAAFVIRWSGLAPRVLAGRSSLLPKLRLFLTRLDARLQRRHIARYRSAARQACACFNLAPEPRATILDRCPLR